MPRCTEPTRLLHRREGRWQAQLGGLRPATGAFRKQPQSTRSARLGSVPVPDCPPTRLQAAVSLPLSLSQNLPLSCRTLSQAPRGS